MQIVKQLLNCPAVDKLPANAQDASGLQITGSSNSPAALVQDGSILCQAVHYKTSAFIFVATTYFFREHIRNELHGRLAVDARRRRWSAGSGSLGEGEGRPTSPPGTNMYRYRTHLFPLLSYGICRVWVSKSYFLIRIWRFGSGSGIQESLLDSFFSGQ